MSYNYYSRKWDRRLNHEQMVNYTHYSSPYMPGSHCRIRRCQNGEGEKPHFIVQYRGYEIGRIMPGDYVRLTTTAIFPMKEIRQYLENIMPPACSLSYSHSKKAWNIETIWESEGRSVYLFGPLFEDHLMNFVTIEKLVIEFRSGIVIGPNGKEATEDELALLAPYLV